MSGLEAFGDAIRVFVEKHLIPFVISIVSATLALAFTPNNFLPLNKIGSTLYFIGVAGIAFLLVKLFVFSAKKIKSRYKQSELKQQQKQRVEEENKHTVELFWSQTDLFSPEDRQLIREFVTTDNAPIERNTNAFYDHGSLLGSDFVVSAIVSNPYKKPIPIQRKENDNRIYIPAYEIIDGVRQYALKHEIFKIAKYSIQMYGKISHFD